MKRLLLLGILPFVLLWGIDAARAGSPLHPEIVLLDAEGNDVLESGAPVSTMKTCGECHDTKYIASHSYHVAVGFDEMFEPGTRARSRAWSFSPGMFGRWDALRYRRLTLPGEEAFDMGVADWIQTFGERHVGGGPALYSRTGVPLADLRPGETVDPETHRRLPHSDDLVPWDWQASGGLEMDCFLCHIPHPAEGERLAALAAGRFDWAVTATLANTTLVERKDDGTWAYARDAFGPDGMVPRAQLKIGDPKPLNCGLCHGRVEMTSAPVALQMGLKAWESESKGQIFSSQLVADSAVNLEDKATRRYPWDVHAARLVGCTDCHHSLNNPVSFAEADRSKPRHLSYDARRLQIGDYLERPSHHFTKGESAQGNVARRLDGTMRRCENCHQAEAIHAEWLPNARRHLQVLLCETCHIPDVSAPARRQCDWTVLTQKRQPRVEHRGIDGLVSDPAALVSGYEPVILPRHQKDGRIRHGPHNLCTGWFWLGGNPERPVRTDVLERAYFVADGTYHPDIVAVLDEDGDGEVAREELRLDTEAKVDAVKRRLVDEGVKKPRIEGCIQPLSLHHGVRPGRFATRRCETCHTRDSRMTRPFELSTYVPFGAEASCVPDSNTRMPGHIWQTEDGRLMYEPVPTASGRYVIGHDRAGWIDAVGGMLILATLVGVVLHALLRRHFERRRRVGVS